MENLLTSVDLPWVSGVCDPCTAPYENYALQPGKTLNLRLPCTFLIRYRRALPAFIRDGIGEDQLIKNRAIILNVLKTLSERNSLGEQETLILAWGQIAR